ncbi:transcriptional regulator [Martiniozyma asiatica (nom. inval.)]|nr:transcriptional regulator [Martiniozyma asiatica]
MSQVISKMDPGYNILPPPTSSRISVETLYPVNSLAKSTITKDPHSNIDLNSSYNNAVNLGSVPIMYPTLHPDMNKSTDVSVYLSNSNSYLNGSKKSNGSSNHQLPSLNSVLSNIQNQTLPSLTQITSNISYGSISSVSSSESSLLGYNGKNINLGTSPVSGSSSSATPAPAAAPVPTLSPTPILEFTISGRMPSIKTDHSFPNMYNFQGLPQITNQHISNFPSANMMGSEPKHDISLPSISSQLHLSNQPQCTFEKDYNITNSKITVDNKVLSSSYTGGGNARKHICKTCGRGFTTSGHLARHNRIHTGVKNHVCPHEECGARFSRQDNCMQHYKTHFKQRKGKRKGKFE